MGSGAHKCIGMHFARMLFLLTFRELIGKYQIEYALGNQEASLDPQFF
jgi:cytochrome P450